MKIYIFGIKLILLSTLVSQLSGCFGNLIQDHNTPGAAVNGPNTLFSPTERTGYWGGLATGKDITDAQRLARSEHNCAMLGGLKSAPTYTGENLSGVVFYRYQCKGPLSVTDQSKTLPSIVTIPSHNESSNQPNSIFDTAKLKCIELGFKAATEGFGKCVLKLSK